MFQKVPGSSPTPHYKTKTTQTGWMQRCLSRGCITITTPKTPSKEELIPHFLYMPVCRSMTDDCAFTAFTPPLHTMIQLTSLSKSPIFTFVQGGTALGNYSRCPPYLLQVIKSSCLVKSSLVVALDCHLPRDQTHPLCG